MAATWPKKSRVLGTRVARLDGPQKATGTAKYTFDINRPGMLHAKILRCPHAHAKLTELDTTDAAKMPGVAAVEEIAKAGTECYYAGTEIVAIAADTEEHAADALRAVKAKYDVLPHLVREEDGLEGDLKTTPGNNPNRTRSNQETRGNADAAFQGAAAVHEGKYGVPVIAHQCLESHGVVCEFDGDGNLTVWASTQAVAGMPGDFGRGVGIPPNKVRCVCHFMGGGFGSKFQAGTEGITCAKLAKKAGKAVKLMLDREEEVTTAGTRPSGFGTVKIAADQAGKIVAFEAHTYGTAGVAAAPGVRFNELPYVYDGVDNNIANVKKDNHVIRTNTAAQRAWRAPGHPQSCVMTEWPIDDLAAKLNLDPMQMRLVNLPPSPPGSQPHSWRAVRHGLYSEQIKKAAELSEWAKKWHPPGKGESKGSVKHGIGMALHTWGGAGRGNNDTKTTISADGSVLVTCSTQDLGTAARTVFAIVAAEVLGLEPKDVEVRVGESQYGRSTGSGGSTTCPGTAPAALNSATAARDALFQKLAPKFGVKPEDLSIGVGKIVDGANKKEYTWKEACARLGMDNVVGTGDFTPGLSNNGVCGVQIAEVAVDTETGVVRCVKIVAVQDCGLLVNKLACESQVAGGVIMGLNPALWEERIMDRTTGRQVNPDMEFYKLGGIEDMPEIVVHMMDMPERGVIGIGEPPTISTTAAIGNAVFNALGVRVPYAPFTPDRVLDALSKGGK